MLRKFPGLWMLVFCFQISLYAQIETNPNNPPEASGPEERIYKVVEDNPHFPGCEESETSNEDIQNCATEIMTAFIYDNLKYPDLAKENGIEGVVVISFIIEKDGKITKAKIVRDIGAGCGQEALRVVNLMPIWIPGKQQGIPVAVQFNLPVKFNLDQTRKQEKEPSQKRKDRAKKSKEEGVTMPHFSGCEELRFEIQKDTCTKEKLKAYLYENTRYPDEARRKGVEGTVVVSFVINKDGSIKDVTILENLEPELDMEALRLVNTMPRWNPGRSNGNPVNFKYNLPIKFALDNILEKNKN